MASSSVDRVQKPWLDAELLIAPQLLGGVVNFEVVILNNSGTQ